MGRYKQIVWFYTYEFSISSTKADWDTGWGTKIMGMGKILRTNTGQQQMPLPTMLLFYRFWLTEICIFANPVSPKTRRVTYKLHSQRCQCFRLSILPALYMQDIRAIFELWGRPFCSSLLISFFHISFVLFTRLTTCFFNYLKKFYPAVNGCWIHVKVVGSTCIYSTLLVVSLNNEPRLAHRSQQSVGSAFQFHDNDLNKSVQSCWIVTKVLQNIWLTLVSITWLFSHINV